MYDAKTFSTDLADDVADAVAKKVFFRLKLGEYVAEIEKEKRQGELVSLSEFLKENAL